ncbi:hypothetical protein BH11PLA1_BH11PLA1_13510 [soil metagenome]
MNSIKAERGASALTSADGRATIWIGDCRVLVPRIPQAAAGTVDLVFADPPFNWNRAYDRWTTTAKKQHGAARVVDAAAKYETWDDGIPREDYLTFTQEWIAACVQALRPGGALWINIPDDTAAEIVVYVKSTLGLRLVNWCIWHYRFGQNRVGGFIQSKVHALYFLKPGGVPTWNAKAVLEPSDRATTYFDPRTMSKKDGMPAGMRVPMDVWYGPNWGRVQGNNTERRAGHDNQLPEAYLERVILACSDAGGVVLDPFVGSGTTAVVAAHYGRTFVGCEYSRANALSALQRLDEIGMVNAGKALGQSSAIFRPRRASAAARQRTNVMAAVESDGVAKSPRRTRSDGDAAQPRKRAEA